MASHEMDGDEPPETASTRERILDVALDLFTEKGFDRTSLREIAERLGVTKAALYYHFSSKDDILMALHLRLHEFGKSALSRMTEEPVTLELWGELLDQIARADAGPAQDLPPARAKSGRFREAPPRGTRSRPRRHPEPIPSGARRSAVSLR